MRICAGHPHQLEIAVAAGGTSKPLGMAERKARLTKGLVSDLDPPRTTYVVYLYDRGTLH